MMRWMIFAPLMVLSGLLYGQVPDYVPTDGLVAWYDFANDACDVAGLAGCFDLIDGAYIGEVEGSDDLALRLDGNYAELAADSNFDLTEFTIACRFYFDTGSQMRVWKGNPQFPDDVNFSFSSSMQGDLDNFDYSQDCESILDNSPNSLQATELQASNTWLNVVITKSSSGDVSLVTANNSYTLSGTESICTETQPIRIGHWWNGDPSPCYGWLDHLGVWSSVLNESEIAQLIQRGPISTGCTDPVACNFNPEFQINDNSCIYPAFGLDDCHAGGSVCGIGSIWDANTQQCVLQNNICGPGTVWDEVSNSCIPNSSDCIGDLNNSGVIGVNDLLLLLQVFGESCVMEAEVPQDANDELCTVFGNGPYYFNEFHFYMDNYSCNTIAFAQDYGEPRELVIRLPTSGYYVGEQVHIIGATVGTSQPVKVEAFENDNWITLIESDFGDEPPGLPVGSNQGVHYMRFLLSDDSWIYMPNTAQALPLQGFND